jgi:hypothetical protein
MCSGNSSCTFRNCRPGTARRSEPLHRSHWYRLVAELAHRIAIPGCPRLVDWRAAVRAVRWHSPGRPGSSALTSRRLPFRLLLALDVIVQCAFLQRRHVYDDLAPVRGVVANGHPLSDRQGKLDLRYPVRVAELLSPAYLREALRLRTARRRLVQIGQFLAELDRLAVFKSHRNAHLRYPAVGGGRLAVGYHCLNVCPLAEELFTLGLSHLSLAPVMMKQFLTPPGRSLSGKHSTGEPPQVLRPSEKSMTHLAAQLSPVTRVLRAA